MPMEKLGTERADRAGFKLGAGVFGLPQGLQQKPAVAPVRLRALWLGTGVGILLLAFAMLITH